MDALQSKYDALKEKLIYEALERKLGKEEWNKLSDMERFDKMMEMKLKIQKLIEEGMSWIFNYAWIFIICTQSFYLTFGNG